MSTTTPARGVDQQRAVRHRGEEGGVDHAGGLRRHRDDEDHDVGVRQQLRAARRWTGRRPARCGPRRSARRRSRPASGRSCGRCRRPRRPARGRPTREQVRPERPAPGVLLADEERDAALRGERHRHRPLRGRRRVRSPGVAQHHPLGQPADEPLRARAEQLDQTQPGQRRRGSRCRASRAPRRAAPRPGAWAASPAGGAVGGVDPVRADPGRQRLHGRRRWPGGAPARGAVRRVRGSAAARRPTLGGRPGSARTVMRVRQKAGVRASRLLVVRPRRRAPDRLRRRRLRAVGPVPAAPRGRPARGRPAVVRRRRFPASPRSPDPGEDGGRPQRRRLRPERADRAGAPARRQRDRRRARHRPHPAGLPRPLPRARADDGARASTPPATAGCSGWPCRPPILEDGLLYAYLSTATDNRVVRFPIGGTPNPVFTGIPRGESHNGGGLLFDLEGHLFVGTGDAGNPALAADPNSLAGKVLRIDVFGRPVGAGPVFSRGHRDVTALCQNVADRDRPTLRHRRHPDGPDEINTVTAGGDYSATGTAPLAEIPAEEGGLGGCAAAPAACSSAPWTASGPRARRRRDRRGGRRPRGVPRRRVRPAAHRRPRPEGALWITTSNRDGVGTPAEDDDKVLRISRRPQAARRCSPRRGPEGSRRATAAQRPGTAPGRGAVRGSSVRRAALRASA